ncbi:MAG: DUF885 domain-containing protein [Dehalococcoidia bacterium]
MPSRVYEIASEYVDRAAALHPLGATHMGVAGHDHEMTDYSPQGEDERAAFEREMLAALEAAPLEGERDRIAREAMAERLRLHLEMHEAGEQYQSLNILFSPFQDVRQCFDLMPRDTEEHWHNIAARLRLVPFGLQTYRRTLEEGARVGMPSTRRQTEGCVEQAAAWSGGHEGVPPFFDSLLEAYDASPVTSEALRRDVEEGARLAAGAYAEMGRFLADEYLPHTEQRDAVGPERYSRSARSYNGVELDLDETYRWGWDELHRIEAEILATCERILPDGSVEDVQRLLEEDPARAIEGVDAFQRWMQALHERTIAELDGVHFDIVEPVKRLEAMIAPAGGALAMYYTGPSEDFSRPGRTWYPTGGKTRFPLWGEVSIAYHEGVPGHHLQIGHVTYLSDRLSRWQRLLGTTSGYAEGWALYAERLMAELGYLENPDYYLGMLRGQALRAARVVVDIGLHLDQSIPQGERYHPGERWTPELAHEFLLQRTYFPENFLASEVTRYLGMPGQAISYKVGERAWFQAREAASRRGGAAFDLKAFHMRAFDLGPMGLDQMRRELGA